MDIKHLAVYLFSLVILSTNGICANFVVGLSSGQLVFVRMVIGSIVLFLAMKISRQRFTFWSHRRSLTFQVLAGISNGFNYLFMFEAYRLVGVSMTTIIMYMAPAIILVLSPLIFKERLTVIKIIGFTIVLFGFLLLNQSGSTLQSSEKGMLYAGIACICYTLVIILNKFASELPGLEKSFLQILISAVVVLLYLVLTADLNFDIQRTDVMPTLYLGVVAAGLGSFFYYSSLPQLSAQTISTFSYMQPVSTLVLSFLVLHERLAANQWIGALLIVGGVLFAEIFHIRKSAVTDKSVWEFSGAKKNYGKEKQDNHGQQD